MKYEKVSNADEVINRAFRPAKLQTLLMEFYEGPEQVVKVIPSPNEYKNKNSAQSSHKTAIRRLGLPIIARHVDGALYLIKLPK